MLRRRWPWWVWLGVGVGWFGSSSGPVRQIQPRIGGSKAYPQSFGSTEFRLERPQPRRDMTILRVARRDHHVSDFRVFVRWGSGRVDPKFRSFSDQNQGGPTSVLPVLLMLWAVFPNYCLELGGGVGWFGSSSGSVRQIKPRI